MAGRGTDDGGDKSGGGHHVPIIVALITVSGAMFTAVLANWDKIFGNRPVVTVSQPAAANKGAPVAAGLTDPAAAREAAQKLSDSQAGAYGATTDVLDDVTRQIQGSSQAPPAAPNITGLWADADGYSFRISQSGPNLAFQTYANGALVGRGEGQITGRALRYGYQSSEDSGSCTAHLSTDGTEISGRCQSVAGPKRAVILNLFQHPFRQMGLS
jgi:hypothetical protein